MVPWWRTCTGSLGPSRSGSGGGNGDRRRLMRIPLGIVATACLAAASAQAQAVRGQLTDSISGAPLGGAFLTLVDEKGAEQARTMTNDAGEFVLRAPAAGTYRIRFKRIGFRPYVSAALMLRVGETTAHNAAIDPLPVRLEQVVVEGERQCDVEAGASVAALWDEVREALAAVVWTQRAPGYWYEIEHFERDRIVRSYGKSRDSTWRTTGFYQAPFRSVPAEQLAATGFVVVDDSGWSYFEPDADVLLSTPFLGTHCFQTKIGRGETDGLVGLAFSPARGRIKPDLTGTLWVNRRSAELSHLEFNYVKLPQGISDSRAGGRATFMRLPTGAWVVRDWLIRMPFTAASRTETGAPDVPRTIGYRERGGTTQEIKTIAGALVFHAESRESVSLAAAPPAPIQPPAPPAPPVAVPAAPSTPPPDTIRGRPVSSGHRSSEVLTKEEFQGSPVTDAFSLVLRYRPQWLQTRGPVSINLPTEELQIYVNHTRWGTASVLRDIAAGDVLEMRYLSGPDATMRYGTNHAGGVIEVTMR